MIDEERIVVVCTECERCNVIQKRGYSKFGKCASCANTKVIGNSETKGTCCSAY